MTDRKSEPLEIDPLAIKPGVTIVTNTGLRGLVTKVENGWVHFRTSEAVSYVATSRQISNVIPAPQPVELPEPPLLALGPPPSIVAPLKTADGVTIRKNMRVYDKFTGEAWRVYSMNITDTPVNCRYVSYRSLGIGNPAPAPAYRAGLVTLWRNNRTLAKASWTLAMASALVAERPRSDEDLIAESARYKKLYEEALASLRRVRSLATAQARKISRTKRILTNRLPHVDTKHSLEFMANQMAAVVEVGVVTGAITPLPDGFQIRGVEVRPVNPGAGADSR